jgi:hypothetical protein
VYAIQIWLFTIPFMTLHRVAMEAFADFQTEPRFDDLSSATFFSADRHGTLSWLGKYIDGFQALEAIAADVPGFDKIDPSHPLQQATAFGMLAFGWFASADGNVNLAPSKHPKRQPVRLVLAVNTNLETASAVEFEDTPNKMMVDPDNLLGPIEDAVKATMEAILEYQKKLGLRK